MVPPAQEGAHPKQRAPALEVTWQQSVVNEKLPGSRYPTQYPSPHDGRGGTMGHSRQAPGRRQWDPSPQDPALPSWDSAQKFRRVHLRCPEEHVTLWTVTPQACTRVCCPCHSHSNPSAATRSFHRTQAPPRSLQFSSTNMNISCALFTKK